MKDSTILEIDVLKTYMRLKDEALRNKWASTVPPEYRQTYNKGGKKDKKAQNQMDSTKEPTPAPDAPAAAPDKADSTS